MDFNIRLSDAGTVKNKVCNRTFITGVPDYHKCSSMAFNACNDACSSILTNLERNGRCDRPDQQMTLTGILSELWSMAVLAWWTGRRDRCGTNEIQPCTNGLQIIFVSRAHLSTDCRAPQCVDGASSDAR